MSFMKVPLCEDEATIARPVIMEIARQVMAKTNIPEDTRIVYRGQSDSVFQPGSEISAKQSEVNNPQLAGGSQFYIEASEVPMQEMIMGEDALQDNTHPTLFNDPKLLIAVLPIKKQMEVTISFRFRSKSKTFAQRWRNTIYQNFANQRDLDIHTVAYGYPFPPEFLPILKYFHALREANAGYGEDYETYFQNHCDPALTTASNQSGSVADIYKPETQTRILGWFDFTGEPEKEAKDNESSTWSTEFSYKFHYEKPTHAFMRFPVAIHNQLVDERLFGKLQKMLWEKNLQYSKYTAANRFFESDAIIDRLMKRHPHQIRIPAHDTIAYGEHVPGTRTLVSVLCHLDKGSDILFNLRELEHHGFHPDILKYIEEEGYKWMPKPWACMLNISLYRNHHLTDPKNLVIDADLNVHAPTGTDMRKVNRVRIGYHTNISQVMQEGIVRLNKYKEALKILVQAGDTKAMDIYRLKPRVDLTWLLDGNMIGTSKQVEQMVDMNRTLDRVTVSISHIRAHRQEGNK